jgi:hypothetical protein
MIALVGLLFEHRYERRKSERTKLTTPTLEAVGQLGNLLRIAEWHDAQQLNLVAEFTAKKLQDQCRRDGVILV